MLWAEVAVPGVFLLSLACCLTHGSFVLSYTWQFEKDLLRCCRLMEELDGVVAKKKDASQQVLGGGPYSILLHAAASRFTCLACRLCLMMWNLSALSILTQMHNSYGGQLPHSSFCGRIFS
jgi:hypothetical protein